MVLVDLIFNYDGEWATLPEIIDTKNQLHIFLGYDSDLLSYIDIVNELISELGFVGV